jgi:hypothetical protein
LAALFGDGLMVDERAVDRPVGLLGGCERIRRVEHLRAVARGRELDRGTVVAVDECEAVGMDPAPQLVVGARQLLLRVG